MLLGKMSTTGMLKIKIHVDNLLGSQKNGGNSPRFIQLRMNSSQEKVDILCSEGNGVCYDLLYRSWGMSGKRFGRICFAFLMANCSLCRAFISTTTFYTFFSCLCEKLRFVCIKFITTLYGFN